MSLEQVTALLSHPRRADFMTCLKEQFLENASVVDAVARAYGDGFVPNQKLGDPAIVLEAAQLIKELCDAWNPRVHDFSLSNRILFDKIKSGSKTWD